MDEFPSQHLSHWANQPPLGHRILNRADGECCTNKRKTAVQISLLVIYNLIIWSTFTVIIGTSRAVIVSPIQFLLNSLLSYLFFWCVFSIMNPLTHIQLDNDRTIRQIMSIWVIGENHFTPNFVCTIMLTWVFTVIKLSVRGLTWRARPSGSLHLLTFIKTSFVTDEHLPTKKTLYTVSLISSTWWSVESNDRLN